MSYNKLSYETYGEIVVFKTQFSSSAGSVYKIIPKELDGEKNIYIPIHIIAHYDNLTGNWGSGATYNIGYTQATSYNDWVQSGSLDVSSRLTNNMTNISPNSNEVFPTGSTGNDIYFRFNTNNTIGTITGSILVSAFVSRPS